MFAALAVPPESKRWGSKTDEVSKYLMGKLINRRTNVAVSSLADTEQ